MDTHVDGRTGNVGRMGQATGLVSLPCDADPIDLCRDTAPTDLCKDAAPIDPMTCDGTAHWLVQRCSTH